MFSGHTVALTMLNFFVTECKLRGSGRRLGVLWNGIFLVFFSMPSLLNSFVTRHDEKNVLPPHSVLAA